MVDWTRKSATGEAAIVAADVQAEEAFNAAWAALDAKESRAGHSEKSRIWNERVDLMRDYHEMNKDPNVGLRDRPYDHQLEYQKALAWSAAIEAAMDDQAGNCAGVVARTHRSSSRQNTKAMNARRGVGADLIIRFVIAAVRFCVMHIVTTAVLAIVIAGVAAVVTWVLGFAF